MGRMSKDCRVKSPKNEKEKENGKKENDEKSKANIVQTEFEALMVNHISVPSNEWLVDSGATSHMCNNINLFMNLTKSQAKTVTTADGNKIKVHGEGDVFIKLYGIDKKVKLINCLFVPDLRHNLLSIAKVVEKRINVIFKNDSVCDYRDDNLIFSARKENGVFKIENHHEDQINTVLNDKNEELIWHKRLGHIGQMGLKKLVDKKLLPIKSVHDIDCSSCLFGKQCRKSFSSSTSKSNDILDLVHTDVCGPMRTASIGGNYYFMTFLDDYSHFSFVYFLKRRNEVPNVLIKFVNFVTNQKGKSIKIIRSDSAQENVNRNVVEFMENKGIQHQKPCPYTPEQNGKAEWLNRTLLDITRTLLSGANLDNEFWAEALHASNYLLNLRPSSSIDFKIPYEIWSGKQADYNHLKVFGCICFVHISRIFRDKLGRKSKEQIFVGYSDDHKGYKVYDRTKNKVFISRDIVFKENEFQMNENDQSNLVDDMSDCPTSYAEAMKRNDWKKMEGSS